MYLTGEVTEFVDWNEFSSGCQLGKDAIELAYWLRNLQIGVKIGDKKYAPVRQLTAALLEKGMLVAGTYKKDNQGVDFFEVLGVTDVDVKYGEGGPVFDSVKQAREKYDLKNMREMESFDGDLPYGHRLRLWARDLTPAMKDVGYEEEGAWYYLYKGRWSRGSGAEQLSLVLLEEVPETDEEFEARKQGEFDESVKGIDPENAWAIVP